MATVIQGATCSLLKPQGLSSVAYRSFSRTISVENQDSKNESIDLGLSCKKSHFRDPRYAPEGGGSTAPVSGPSSALFI